MNIGIVIFQEGGELEANGVSQILYLKVVLELIVDRDVLVSLVKVGILDVELAAELGCHRHLNFLASVISK